MAEWHTGPRDLEFFEFHNWRWNILRAKNIAKHRTPVQVLVDEFIWQLDNDQFDKLVSEEEQVRLALNRRAVDLSHPVIVCDLTSTAATHYDYPRILIDGWHRVAVAYESGVSKLPAVVLTADEGLSVSEYYACHGCQHHSHKQFDPDDWEDCNYFCDACSTDREVRASMSA